MTNKDYYEILGVSRDVSPEELKRAYRKKALELHPDRNPDRHDAEEHFKELNQAYSVLADPEKRATYDRFGAEAVGGGGGAYGADPSVFADMFGNGSGLEDLFSQFFGGSFFGQQQRAGGPRGGSDLRYELQIEFEEAAFGTEVKLRVPRSETCPGCTGTGAAAGGLSTCRTCRGAGRVAARMGFMQIMQTCPTCAGRGRTIEKRCEECKGAGRLQTERTVKVRVPPGVDEGTRLRVSGEGDGGSGGGPPGDLYVDISIKPHERFVRNGADVHAEFPVSFPDLVLGGAFTVKTLHGDEEIELPAGTDPGYEIRLRGKGIARLGRRGQGDHVLHVVAKTPKKLGADERRLWESLREASGAAGTEEKGLFEKVKDLFGGE